MLKLQLNLRPKRQTAGTVFELHFGDGMPTAVLDEVLLIVKAQRHDQATWSIA